MRRARSGAGVHTEIESRAQRRVFFRLIARFLSPQTVSTSLTSSRPVVPAVPLPENSTSGVLWRTGTRPHTRVRPGTYRQGAPMVRWKVVATVLARADCESENKHRDPSSPGVCVYYYPGERLGMARSIDVPRDFDSRLVHRKAL